MLLRSPAAILGLVLAIVISIGGLLTGIWVYGERQFKAGEFAKQAEFARAAALTNKAVEEFSTADALLAAVRAEELRKRNDAAKLVPGGCPATPDQAEALTQIRRTK